MRGDHGGWTSEEIACPATRTRSTFALPDAAGRYRIEYRPREGRPQDHGEVDLADGGSETISITVDP